MIAMSNAKAYSEIFREPLADEIATILGAVKFLAPFTTSHIPAINKKLAVADRLSDGVTLNRTSPVLIPDWEGIVREIPADEAAMQGGRRIVNVTPGDIVSDPDFQGKGTLPPTVTQNVIYKGRKCVKIDWQAGSGLWSTSRAQFQTKSVMLLAGHSYIASMRIAVALQIEPGVWLYDSGSHGDLGSVFPLTQDWKKISFANGIGVTTHQVYVPATDTVAFLGFWWGGTITNPITMYLAEYMVEDVSGQTSTVPSEYILPASAKWVAQKNGNQLANGIVEEAEGVELATIKGIRSEGGGKNQLKQCRDLSQGTWNKRTGGIVGVTFDDSVINASGVFGSSKITNLGVNAVDDVWQVTPALPIAGQRVEPSLYIKKITTTGILRLVNPTGSSGRWDIDFAKLDSGWETITRDHPAVSIVAEFIAHLTNKQSGHHFYTLGGPLDFYVDLCQLETGTTNNDRTFTSSPIVTTTAAVVRQSSKHNYDGDAHLQANDWCGWGEYIPTSLANSGEQDVWGFYISSNDYFRLVLKTNNQFALRKKVAGVTKDAAHPLITVSVNGIYRYAWRMKKGIGMDIWINGIKGTTQVDDTDLLTGGATFGIGFNSQSSNFSYGIHRNLTFVDRPCSDTFLRAKSVL